MAKLSDYMGKQGSEKDYEPPVQVVTPVEKPVKRVRKSLGPGSAFKTPGEVAEAQAKTREAAQKDRNEGKENYQSLGRPSDKRSGLHYVRCGGMVVFETRRRLGLAFAGPLQDQFASQDAVIDAAINYFLDAHGIEPWSPK